MAETITNMYTEQAIRKSVEGGYGKNAVHGEYIGVKSASSSWVVFINNKKTTVNREGEEIAINVTSAIPIEKILLDTSFWSSLGTALGWGKDKSCPVCGNGHYLMDFAYKWECEWHRFIDHLSFGGTAESYFQTLLQDVK